MGDGGAVVPGGSNQETEFMSAEWPLPGAGFRKCWSKGTRLCMFKMNNFWGFYVQHGDYS